MKDQSMEYLTDKELNTDTNQGFCKNNSTDKCFL